MSDLRKELGVKDNADSIKQILLKKVDDIAIQQNQLTDKMANLLVQTKALKPTEAEEKVEKTLTKLINQKITAKKVKSLELMLKSTPEEKKLAVIEIQQLRHELGIQDNVKINDHLRMLRKEQRPMWDSEN